MTRTDGKSRAAFFSRAEQALLMEAYEEQKAVITQKGNTVAINKAREMAWQKVADRLNESHHNSPTRTSQQVKIKYKNISQIASKKKTDAASTCGGPQIEELTPAEELALSCGRCWPIDGIKEESSLDIIPQCAREQYIEVTGDVKRLLDPLTPPEAEATSDPYLDGPSTSFDEDMVSAYADVPEDVRALYKRKLLVSIESKKLDMEYKRLLIKKVKLEITKLEKDLDSNV